MATVAVFRIPAADTYLERTFERLPHLRCEIEQVVESAALGHWFENVTRSELEAALETDPTVEGFEHVTTDGEKQLYEIDWSGQVLELYGFVVDHGGTVLNAIGEDGEWTVRLRFENREDVSDFYEVFAEREISVDVVQVQELSDRSYEDLGLTDEQYEALETAINLGYFEIPRETQLGEVADELDISDQALSERLRRAYHSIVTSELAVTQEENRSEGGVG